MSHPTRRDLLKIGAASVFSLGAGLESHPDLHEQILRLASEFEAKRRDQFSKVQNPKDELHLFLKNGVGTTNNFHLGNQWAQLTQYNDRKSLLLI